MKMFAAMLAIVAGVSFLVPAGLPAAAAELPRAKPEAVGFSPERLARLDARLRADIEKQVIPGAVLLIARQGKVAYFEAMGLQNAETKTAMRRDSIFRIYSMTKPLTSVAAMMLMEEGRLGLGDPVARTIPAFAKMQLGVEKPGADGKPVLEMVPSPRAMTVQDLLRHTSGLTYGFYGDTAVKKFWRESGSLGGDYTNAEFAERLAKLPLAYTPGTIWDYSYSTDILGRVIEVTEGKSLGAVLQARLLDPLGMKDTGFYITDAERQARIAEPLANDRTIGIGVEFSEPREKKQWNPVAAA